MRINFFCLTKKVKLWNTWSLFELKSNFILTKNTMLNGNLSQLNKKSKNFNENN